MQFRVKGCTEYFFRAENLAPLVKVIRERNLDTREEKRFIYIAEFYK